jgi:hypothetical protein
MKVLIKSLAIASLTIGGSAFAADKTMIDYFCRCRFMVN